MASPVPDRTPGARPSPGASRVAPGRGARPFSGPVVQVGEGVAVQGAQRVASGRGPERRLNCSPHLLPTQLHPPSRGLASLP